MIIEVAFLYKYPRKSCGYEYQDYKDKGFILA